MKLTRDILIREAERFCSLENNREHPDLLGINDGKTIGTYIEHEFKKYLIGKYEFNLGSSSHGVDFPDKDINTDLKVTSLNKPQNSCPFRDIKQKIYGLGYNLLLFIYEKNEKEGKCFLFFDSCTFINAAETGDYGMTRNLRKMVENNWSKDRIVYYLEECKLPGDETTLDNLAEEIIRNPPRQGVLTISNAFQWRIKYGHTVKRKVSENANYKKEYGDYQTPFYFAKKVMNYINNHYNISPDLIIEPTCGIGNFIKAANLFYPQGRIIGIDINKSYLDEAKLSLPEATFVNENIFDYELGGLVHATFDEYLIVGNPPWVTNTRLSKYESDNIPAKTNIKNYDFFNATTGMSNFDISENIILHMIEEFRNVKCSFVFLCKYKVACNVFEYLVHNNISVSVMDIVRFDSMKIFKADTSSCILFIQFNDNKELISFCNVHELDGDGESCIGFVDGKFYSNLDNIVDIDGSCCFEWRQGVKHDCSNIMELTVNGDNYQNKNNDIVSLEDDLLYPLLKSSDVKVPVVTDSAKRIIITQQKLKEDTGYIKQDFPLIWKYLTTNEEHFSNRKSNIYAKAPQFSIFGIGEYTFRKYKVAISGFYKEGMFSLVYNNKPMMLDDTCYYLSFDDYDTAYTTMLILNSWVVKSFLQNIVLLDSKRPYTKKVLKRIDIKKALKILNLENLIETEKELKLPKHITEQILEKYKEKIKKGRD